MLAQQGVAGAPDLVDMPLGIAMAEADMGDAQARQGKGLCLRFHRRAGAAERTCVHRLRCCVHA